MRPAGRKCRRGLVVLAAAIAACAAGCNPDAGAGGLAPPVRPSADAELARRWYYQWEMQEDILAGGEVRDMYFVLGTRGRDWREASGPDGYPVRVFLLDELGRSIRAEGSLQGLLVRAPHDARANEALHALSIDPEGTRRRFRLDRIPGYLLRLDWGAGPPGRGEFMLVIRWISADGGRRVTRNLVFPDRIEHHEEITTTRAAQP